MLCGPLPSRSRSTAPVPEKYQAARDEYSAPNTYVDKPESHDFESGALDTALREKAEEKRTQCAREVEDRDVTDVVSATLAKPCDCDARDKGRRCPRANERGPPLIEGNS